MLTQSKIQANAITQTHIDEANDPTTDMKQKKLETDMLVRMLVLLLTQSHQHPKRERR